MDSHLLPAPDDAPLCSAFTKMLGVRPVGTGLCLERVVLVAVPEPWPKPALAHPVLKPAAAALAGNPVRSRLFAAVPWAMGEGTVVELYERDGVDFYSYRWTVDDPAEVTDVVAAIASARPSAHGMPGVEVTVPTFLVCTQGSHDACCGTSGAALADRIEAERPDYRLRRVSHTGGHRFAPTFLAMPQGRMWAYADLALVDRVAAGSVTVDDLRMYCRGWLGATPGAAQVAELAARIEAANPFLEAPSIRIVTDDEDITRCEVTVDDATFWVGVRPGREVPTIACESPGGLPAKPAREYDWTAMAPSNAGEIR